MKCCKEILLPDGKQIPFCAYNSVGYREQATQQLAGQQRARIEADSAEWAGILGGKTEGETLTRITCGGDFHVATREYASRIVMRAIRR